MPYSDKSTSNMSAYHWKGSSVVSVQQFKRDEIMTVLKTAKSMEAVVNDKGKCNILSGKILANIFYEPSTRTSASFQAAMLRLGGDVIQINAAVSSSKKGETLQDTIRCLECYTDVVVLRHPKIGSSALAAKYCKSPVLNAGDGPGEHPTQALLDTFTIYSELGKIDGLTVTLLGDLKFGRTVHSLAQVLCHFDGVTINFVAPDQLQIPEKYMQIVKDAGIQYRLASALSEDILNNTDVLYVTRIQKERFDTKEEYEKFHGVYIVSKETLSHMKSKSIIMHPLPRVGEILEEVDDDPRAAYFRQMKNGMFTRMALLKLCLLGN